MFHEGYTALVQEAAGYNTTPT